LCGQRSNLFGLDGSPQGEIPLPGLGSPGIGSIVSIDAQPDDDEVRFVFTSFTQPPTAWISRLKPGAIDRLVRSPVPERGVR